MCRHSHDCSCAIAHQYIVGHPHRDFLVVDRVDGICSGKYPCLLLGKVSAVKV